MGEISLYSYMKGGMVGRWDLPVKHADAFTEGIADVSAWIPPAGNVFIELKDIDRWPPRGGAIKVDLTEEQALFLRKRRGWVFFRVAREYLLISHENLSALDGTHGKDIVVAAARIIWRRSVDWKRFTEIVGNKQW